MDRPGSWGCNIGSLQYWQPVLLIPYTALLAAGSARMVHLHLSSEESKIVGQEHRLRDISRVSWQKQLGVKQSDTFGVPAAVTVM